MTLAAIALAAISPASADPVATGLVTQVVVAAVTVVVALLRPVRVRTVLAGIGCTLLAATGVVTGVLVLVG
ncbi:MAG: hypothetical protein KJ548_05990, partial [Actinobacteria bacterium]|nr:hypothetical protein [Actinomycetota bacterium]